MTIPPRPPARERFWEQAGFLLNAFLWLTAISLVVIIGGAIWSAVTGP